MEEFAKISSCETAKERWDKLEILYESTKQEKEARINILVHKYELFMMKEDETIEEMFTRFSKIVGDLKALGKSYSNGRQVRKFLWSLPRVWEPKVIAIESGNLDQMIIDELRYNLITFEKIHLQRHGHKEKRRNVASKTILDETESEEEDEEDQEDLAMILKGIYSIMRRRKQKKKSQLDKNSERNNARWNNKGPA